MLGRGSGSRSTTPATPGYGSVPANQKSPSGSASYSAFSVGATSRTSGHLSSGCRAEPITSLTAFATAGSAGPAGSGGSDGSGVAWDCTCGVGKRTLAACGEGESEGADTEHDESDPDWRAAHQGVVSCRMQGELRRPQARRAASSPVADP